jgi:hypothetical protein
MSNGLFVRSYPAVGVQIVPAEYGPGYSGYTLLLLLPVLAIWWALHANVEKSSWLKLILMVYALGAIFATAFLRSLKLQIQTNGISYGNLIRGTRFIAYSEISTVVVLTDLHARIGVWPNFTLPNTIVITSKVETGMFPIKIPMFFFPVDALAQMTHLLKPEEWDVGAGA